MMFSVMREVRQYFVDHVMTGRTHKSDVYVQNCLRVLMYVLKCIRVVCIDSHQTMYSDKY